MYGMGLPALDSVIRAARTGEPAAREVLAVHLLYLVLPWVVRLGGPGVDRDEAAHDVLMTVLRRLDDLEGTDRLEAWTFGITRRTVASHRRRAWWRRWAASPVPERVDPAPSPLADAIDQQLSARVQAVLEELPAAQREVLVLCDVEERSHTEAAILLGVPEGTVKSRLRLGRARFRAVAQQKFPDLTLEASDD